MQNSMVVFILFVSDWKYPFWTHLVQKIKTVNLRWNLEPLLIRILRIQWRRSVFLFWTGNKLLGNLIQKMKIVSLSWNLVLRLIPIPDFAVSKAILNPTDISCTWFKLNFGPTRAYFNLRNFSEKIGVKRQYFHFL